MTIRPHVIRLRTLVLAAVVAVTSLIGVSQAEAQVTAAPAFSASTVDNVTTLTITDATPGASIYYAPGGRTPTTSSIEYTGPLTITLPFTINAIAVAPGYTQSPVSGTTYSTVLGTTAIRTSVNPAIVGHPITFNATVTTNGPPLPGGSLQFYVNDVPLGPPMTLISNSASYTTSALPQAYLSVTAVYLPTSGAPTTNAKSEALIQGVYESQRQTTNVWFNDASKPLGSGFNHPYGVAVDSNNNLFVADSGNGVVKELTAASGYSTINTLTPTFYNPTGVAFDASNNLFAVDPTVNALYELPAANGYSTKSSVGSGFNSPYGVAVGPNGDVFVADTGNHQVKHLTASTNYVASSAVGGTFQYPWGVAVDSSGNLFATDIGSGTVKLSYGPSYSSSAALGGRGFFANPYGLAIDGNDNLFVTDLGYGGVREISLIDGWSTVSSAGGGLAVPIGVAIDGSGNVFVTDTNNNAVREISGTGGNFGSVAVGSTSSFAISMNFFFNAATTLGSTAVLTTPGGTPSPNFSDAGTGSCYPNTPYAGVSGCTVDVVFNPQQAGPLSAAVELLDGSGNLLAYGTVQGVAQ